MPFHSIALFYGHVARNIGDVAINRGTMNLIGSAFPDARVRAVLLDAERSQYLDVSLGSFDGGPEVEFVHFSARDKDPLQYALYPQRLLEDSGCDDADLILLASGEHLFSYADNPNHRNLFWRTLPAFAAEAAGKPVALLPATFGPYENASSQQLLARISATGARIAVRDLRSQAVIAAVAPDARPRPALDPAFFLSDTIAPDDRRFGRVGIVMRSEGIGIRLSPDAREAFAREAANKSADSIAAVRFTKALIETVLSESDRRIRVFIQTETDRSVVEGALEGFAGGPLEERIEVVCPEAIDDYLALLSEVDCVVASRFHALILGLVCGKPGFGVYFDVHGHKIPGLMELLDGADSCVNLSTTAVADAAKAAAAWSADPWGRYGPVWQRLDELRRGTVEWIAEPFRSSGPLQEPPLDSVRALVVEAAGIPREEKDKVRLRGATRRIQQLDQRVADLEVRLDKTSRQLVDAQERSSTLEKRRIAVEESISFRLGRTLVSAGTSGQGLAKLPADLWALHREGRTRRKSDGNK